MFGRIARRYDVANRVLSLGLDHGWRRRLVAAVQALGPKAVLDVATGSGDVAFALARALPGAEVLGIDFCKPMLEEAERKRAAAGPGACPGVRFALGDALNLPAAPASFDAVTIAFGLRNLSDRARFFAEVRRVLRPEGGLFVLEFSQPAAWLRPAYFFYLGRVLPIIGGRLAGDPGAYAYLDRTIRGFPGRKALTAEMERAGFRRVEATALAGGSVALHAAAEMAAGTSPPR